MKRKSKFRGFLKRVFPSNPLSYLGWLGVFGILGVFFAPTLVPFLLCFPFFRYRSMVADELFWENVRRSATRGFFAVFLLDSTVLIGLFIRGMAVTIQEKVVDLTKFQENTVTMSIFTHDQLFIAFFTFLGSVTLMLLVFTGSMMKFRRQEKHLMQEQEV